MGQAPVPIRKLRETVPEGVARVVHKALAKAPADRFSSAHEFAASLTPVRRLNDGGATSSRPSLNRRHVLSATAALSVLAVGAAVWKSGMNPPGSGAVTSGESDSTVLANTLSSNLVQTLENEPGKVIHGQLLLDSVPMRQATVTISNSGVAMATDADGRFAGRIPEEFITDLMSLTIRYQGVEAEVRFLNEGERVYGRLPHDSTTWGCCLYPDIDSVLSTSYDPVFDLRSDHRLMSQLPPPNTAKSPRPGTSGLHIDAVAQEEVAGDSLAFWISLRNSSDKLA